MRITSLKNRFEELKISESVFRFMFDSKKLKSLNDNELQKCHANVYYTFFSW